MPQERDREVDEILRRVREAQSGQEDFRDLLMPESRSSSASAFARARNSSASLSSEDLPSRVPRERRFDRGRELRGRNEDSEEERFFAAAERQSSASSSSEWRARRNLRVPDRSRARVAAEDFERVAEAHVLRARAQRRVQDELEELERRRHRLRESWEAISSKQIADPAPPETEGEICGNPYLDAPPSRRQIAARQENVTLLLEAAEALRNEKTGRRSRGGRVRRALRLLKRSFLLFGLLLLLFFIFAWRQGYSPDVLFRMARLETRSAPPPRELLSLLHREPAALSFVEAFSGSSVIPPAESTLFVPPAFEKQTEVEAKKEAVVSLSQFDPRWAFRDYAEEKFGFSGSGPCALGMILMKRGYAGLHPLAVAEFMKQGGYDRGDAKMLPEGIDALVARFALRAERTDLSADRLRAYLAQGALILAEKKSGEADAEPSLFPPHRYVVLTQWSRGGEISLADPARPSQKERKESEASLMPSLVSAYVFLP